MPINKKLLSERDICTKYITPALEAAGWDRHLQLLEEVSFTDGKIYVRGKLAARGKGKRADYILYYKPNIPIAIIEAKDNTHSLRAGIQQALEYARILDIPCVFSSNGDGFLFHDRSQAAFVMAEGHPCVTHDSTQDAEVAFGHDKSDDHHDIEQELSLDQFPSPAELWEKYKRYRGIATSEEERIAAQDYYHNDDVEKVDFSDLICHVAYDQPPLTRRERALNVKKRDYFTKYGEQARRVLEALLDKYADEGTDNLESLDVLKVRPLTQFGSPIEILREFGGKERFFAAVRELEGEIYRVA